MKELTDFVEQPIVILDAETEAGALTPLESSNYINLLQQTAKHIFQSHSEYYEEVCNVTKPTIKVPSMVIRELQQAIVEKDTAIAEMDIIILQMNEALALKQAHIAILEQQLASLQSK